MIQTGNTTKTTPRSPRTGVRAIAVLGSALASMTIMAALGGCRGERTDAPPRQFFPDMDDQPKLKAQSESAFFEDGHSQRLPVEGTVAFGSDSLVPVGDQAWVGSYAKDRDDMLKADETYYFGLVKGNADESNPQYIDRMPVEVNKDLITRGMERFNIYCSMCHGYKAMGNDTGTVGKLMNVRPVNLLDAKYRDRSGDTGTDGYLFHIIRNGLWSPDGSNRMPSYGHAVDEQDAWAIVAYIRTLQKAFDAKGRRLGMVETSSDSQEIASSENGGDE
jgi:mono/diheme cytochrome c family protein